MGFITWNDHYSVKVPEIDDQHKKLIALANQLYDAMRAGKGLDVLGTVLTELVDYTAYHFECEERLLLQHGYPEHDEHKEQHDALAVKARQFMDDFTQGQGSRAMDVMLFFEQLAECPYSRSGQALCFDPARQRRFLIRRNKKRFGAKAFTYRNLSPGTSPFIVRPEPQPSACLLQMPLSGIWC